MKIYGTENNKKIIKVTTFKTRIRESGLENCNYNFVEKGSVNNEKLDVNLSRTRAKIFELAICNKWDYFFTATLDPSKFNRQDLRLFHKSLTQFIRDYNKKYNLHIKFLLIPELHSDKKSWHMHGFIFGLPLQFLHQFKIGDVMGAHIAKKVRQGDFVYSWTDYLKKFGFNDLEPIKDEIAVSKYVTKYITKELASNVTEIGAHQYYHSRGLNTSQTIKKGTMYKNIAPDFENEYIKTTTFEYSDELLEKLLQSFK